MCSENTSKSMSIVKQEVGMIPHSMVSMHPQGVWGQGCMDGHWWPSSRRTETPNVTGLSSMWKFKSSQTEGLSCRPWTPKGPFCVREDFDLWRQIVPWHTVTLLTYLTKPVVTNPIIICCIRSVHPKLEPRPRSKQPWPSRQSLSRRVNVVCVPHLETWPSVSSLTCGIKM